MYEFADFFVNLHKFLTLSVYEHRQNQGQNV
jgi:hypothetical protein